MFVVVFTFVFPKAEPVAGLPKALPPNILIAWKNTNEVSDEREGVRVQGRVQVVTRSEFEYMPSREKNAITSRISINSNTIVYNDSSASAAAVCSSASLALIFGLGSGNKRIVIFLNISSFLHFQELRFQGLFLILERQPLLCIKFRAVGQ